jgi:predicted phage terminase large subunit-like protein
MQTENDKYRYQSSEFQYIGFDELTQFARTMYLYPFSRLRKREGMNVPLRVRGATNPGGSGHDWVMQRFLIEDAPGRRFIPARLEDNPYLDREQYEASLSVLDPVTRAQLRHGDWKVRAEGNLFKRDWFEIIDPDRVPVLKDVVRCWDLAATTEDEADDPDYVAGVKMGVSGSTYYVMHVARDRLTPQGVERLISRTAAADTDAVKIRIEQEGAASGKIVRSHFLRMLDGYDARFTGIPRNSKLTRAGPFSAACERGDVKIIRGTWTEAFLDELGAFPQEGVHDDQVDAASGAYAALAGGVRQFTPADWGKVIRRPAISV